MSDTRSIRASSVSVRDNPRRSRFEVFVDEREAGVADYDLEPGAIVLFHTEVYPEFRGGRVALDLAAFALNTARQRGLRVIPSCSFIRRFIRAHPEYRDLVSR